MIFIMLVPVLPAHSIEYIYGYVYAHMLTFTITVKLPSPPHPAENLNGRWGKLRLKGIKVLFR